VVEGALQGGELNEAFTVEEGKVNYLNLVLPNGKTAGPGTSDHVSCILGAAPTPLQIEEVGSEVRRQVRLNFAMCPVLLSCLE